MVWPRAMKTSGYPSTRSTICADTRIVGVFEIRIFKCHRPFIHQEDKRYAVDPNQNPH